MDQTSWIEWRAIYRTPASFLATPLERERGWVEERTSAYLTKEEAHRSAKYRSEETLAYVVGYECRKVEASTWTTVAEG